MQVFHDKDISSSTFLVTGGAGFIGSHIVEYLLMHDAAKVRVLDNLETGFLNNISAYTQHPSFEFLRGDIRDYHTCRQVCEGIDFVCHQAALGSVPRSVSDPVTTNAVNVSGFLNMITAAKDAGVKTFVYASSSAVYGDEAALPKIEHKTGNPLSPYAVSKKTNELYATVFGQLYGLKAIGLRYFNVFGPRQDPDGPYAAVVPLFINSLLKKSGVFINGDGEQTRDFTYVANAVQANVKALLCDNPDAFGKVYNIAVGENYSVNRLYQTIAGILGTNQQPLYRDARQGDIRNSLADISEAEKLLGYHPQVRFDDGIRETVAYFKTIQ